MKRIIILTLILVFSVLLVSCSEKAENIPDENNINNEDEIETFLFEGESSSVLFPAEMVNIIRENYTNNSYLLERKIAVVAGAEKWINMSDDELWDLIIDPELLRSWMVLSDGNCPTCGKSVPMYDWAVDPYNNPWKMTCPHCNESFPTNDFATYYKSGLGEDGRFSYDRADSSLLFNVDHPDADDPLHMYGVDDGRGYTEGENTWYFVATYNVRGNWHRYIQSALGSLSEAYLLTGNQIYAHKCTILLDRLADLYSEYDYYEQGILYEKDHECKGYISYRINSAGENADLAQEFEKIIDGIKGDEELVTFLSAKAKKCGFENKKDSSEAIIQNIRVGLIKEIVDNPKKYECNFPWTDVTLLLNKIVLEWPENRDEILERAGDIITESTKVDGLSGESGMEDYAKLTKSAVNTMLQNLMLIDNGKFLDDLIDAYPGLMDMYSFHVDTLCLDEYYPRIGDGGKFGVPIGGYVGYGFDKYMLWKLYEKTNDTRYVKAMYMLNGEKVAGMLDTLVPHLDNVQEIHDQITDIINAEGYIINQPSVNKQEWGLSILRTGENINRTAFWLFYGMNPSHGHKDTMSIGLFAKGMELIAEIGYPDIGFGGWDSDIANWAKHGFAHNKVISNRMEQLSPSENTSLFFDKEIIKVAQAQGRTNRICNQYERTIVLIDIDDENSYCLDISRINTTKGNYESFIRGTAGDVTINGIELVDKDLEFNDDVFLKDFKGQENVSTGWNMDLKVEDFFGVNDPVNHPVFDYTFKLQEKSDQWVDRDIHLNFTSLTNGADVYIGESLAINYIEDGETKQLWIPVAIERIMDHENETAAFAGIYEPYENDSNIISIDRLDLQYGNGSNSEDINIAANIKLKNGNEDLIISFDIANKETNSILVQTDWQIETDAELCIIRKNPEGKVIYLAVCKGSYLKIANEEFNFNENDEAKEIFID